MRRSPRPGPKGLTREEIVETAVRLLEEEGPDGFSVRKVAAALGRDPMAVLYHVKSKLELERAMGDWLNERLVPPDRGPWRTRLRNLARQYRELAQRYPATFPLLLRFWVTGPADWRHTEAVYAALTEAGLGDRDVVDLCCGFYASVLGLAAADSGGLIRPADEAVLAELAELPPEQFPHTTRLSQTMSDRGPSRVYERMVDLLLDGIERQARPRRR